MKGLVTILVCYALGLLVEFLTAGIVPGSIAGMIILFAALRLKAAQEESVKPVAGFLLRHMMLFFVPVAAGIMVSYRIAGENFAAILVIVVFTTLSVLATVGLIMQKRDKADV